MLRRSTSLRVIGLVLVLALPATLLACGDDAPAPAASSEPSCQSSSAKSGGLCQLNFFCDEATGDGPSAYCTAASGSCDCIPEDNQPKSKTFVLAGVCDKERAEFAEIVNRECGYGL